MESGALSSMMHSFGLLPEYLVAQYIEQVLNGLIYLHDEGVVHRDIKVCCAAFVCMCTCVGALCWR